MLLPTWLRCARLYQALVARFLRITVEWVGGVDGAMPPGEGTASSLFVRKTVGNVIELAGFVAVGWSPLWVLAAASDLSGGSRAYLKALVTEMARAGVLAQETEVATIEELLQTLEGTTAVMADLVDVPPLNVADLRRSWAALQASAADLPEPAHLAKLFEQLQATARQQRRSLLTVSSLVAASAMRAGLQVGATHLFDYYRQALGRISREGWATYAVRVLRPYFVTAGSHFDPRRITRTERLLGRKASPGSQAPFRGQAPPGPEAPHEPTMPPPLPGPPAP
ncbi:MAG: hypothetical protein GX605_04580 [Chloroflexi bacterium]|nr:hypothetical protein [Chloroflexota bacterium]